jgi:hypothetical protein
MFRDVLFPDVKNFRPPDRAMSATDQRVGERLAMGMNITEATREGDAESNKMSIATRTTTLATAGGRAIRLRSSAPS